MAPVARCLLLTTNVTLWTVGAALLSGGLVALLRPEWEISRVLLDDDSGRPPAEIAGFYVVSGGMLLLISMLGCGRLLRRALCMDGGVRELDVAGDGCIDRLSGTATQRLHSRNECVHALCPPNETRCSRRWSTPWIGFSRFELLYTKTLRFVHNIVLQLNEEVATLPTLLYLFSTKTWEKRSRSQVCHGVKTSLVCTKNFDVNSRRHWSILVQSLAVFVLLVTLTLATTVCCKVRARRGYLAVPL
nr:uncharacterized protein LOC119169868 [Rhipicephalus microplus]